MTATRDQVGQDQVSQDQPALELTFARRIFVLVTVLVASSAFNAATFSVAAILPQVQGD